MQSRCATIVVPDDFPSVFQNTGAHERASKLADTRVYSARGADDERELIKRIDGARVAINIRAHARFTEGVFAACPNLAMVSIWGTGTDNVDIDAARRHRVTVCNTPGVSAFAVAEHTMALMLAAARRLPCIDRALRAGTWPRGTVTQCFNKTIGVFGTGAIGARVATLANALGMKVLAWSARRDDAHIGSLGARPASKEEILRTADFVSLHLRLTPENEAFIARDEFLLMRNSAILINTARAALVERAALLDALTQRRIAGAGLDVFHDEPLRPIDPILALDNVVLSPHNAGQTAEVVGDGLLRAVQNVQHFLEGSPTDVVVAP
jgi:phosphoglycerate dehydrogenase-like enzyme